MNLREWMFFNGLKQNELAKMIGVNSRTIYFWRKGIQKPSKKHMQKIRILTQIQKEEDLLDD